MHSFSPQDFQSTRDILRILNETREALAKARENYRAAVEALNQAKRIQSPWPHPIHFLPETDGENS